MVKSGELRAKRKRLPQGSGGAEEEGGCGSAYQLSTLNMLRKRGSERDAHSHGAEERGPCFWLSTIDSRLSTSWEREAGSETLQARSGAGRLRDSYAAPRTPAATVRRRVELV